jgi:hypothetical protein
MLEGTKLIGIIMQYKDYFVKYGYKKNISSTLLGSQIKRS